MFADCISLWSGPWNLLWFAFFLLRFRAEHYLGSMRPLFRPPWLIVPPWLVTPPPSDLLPPWMLPPSDISPPMDVFPRSGLLPPVVDVPTNRCYPPPPVVHGGSEEIGLRGQISSFLNQFFLSETRPLFLLHSQKIFVHSTNAWAFLCHFHFGRVFRWVCSNAPLRVSVTVNHWLSCSHPTLIVK